VTAGLTSRPEGLLAYTPVLSTGSSIPVLVHSIPREEDTMEGCLFSRGASSLDAFSSYPQQLSCPACPVGQPVHQRLRCPVPLVLGTTSSQTPSAPIR